MTEYIIKPVGIVKNLAEKEVLKFSNNDIKLDVEVAVNQGKNLIRSQIIINKEYIECLDGIEDFSHIIVSFWTHKVPESARQIKKVHPAGMKDMPMKGIFATRSPVRPNPICKTTVKLLERNGATLLVEGLDAINNSPVIDIKPHLPFYDSPLNVRLAGWMYDLMNRLKEITKSSDAQDSKNPYSTDIAAHPCLNHDDQKRK